MAIKDHKTSVQPVYLQYSGLVLISNHWASPLKAGSLNPPVANCHSRAQQTTAFSTLLTLNYFKAQGFW